MKHSKPPAPSQYPSLTNWLRSSTSAAVKSWETPTPIPANRSITPSHRALPSPGLATAQPPSQKTGRDPSSHGPTADPARHRPTSGGLVGTSLRPLRSQAASSPAIARHYFLSRRKQRTDRPSLSPSARDVPALTVPLRGGVFLRSRRPSP